MFKKLEMASKSFIKKKHINKNKAYWCAPRKVKSTTNVIRLDKLLPLNENPKKKRRRKVRKSVKKLRRIDILALPKSNPKYKVTGTASKKANNTASSRKNLRPNKLKTTKNISERLMIKSRKKNSSPIVLPKKIGLRLFSMVRKKIKELTDSKSI